MSKMTALAELIQAMEVDDAVVSTRFLTDGDPEAFAPSVTAILDWVEQYGFSRPEARILESMGYTWIKGDCLCFSTKKGIINTGIDDI